MAALDSANVLGGQPESIQLEVLIVGGGIAGLAAAIVMSRAGHNVTVFEKSSFKREAGFIIALGSNATAILNTFGFDFSKSRAVDCTFYTIYDATSLELRSHYDTTRHTKVPGYPSKSFLRPDLHDELKRLALFPPDGHKAPKIMLDAKVVSVDIVAGTVTLANGSTFAGDIIIGADGERSVVKAAFNDPNSLRQAPFKVFRSIVPTERVLEDESSKALYNLSRNRFASFWNGGLLTVSLFEARDGTLQDLEAGYPILDLKDRKAEQNHAKAKAKMLELFKDFHPEIVKLLQKAENVTDWEVYNSLPLPHLFKSKALLIGDAAHSMSPQTGQGGSQSIEDCGALSILLSSLSSKSEIPQRFQLFSDLRKERLAMVQSTSSVVPGLEKNILKVNPRHRLARIGIRTAEEHLEMLFRYDVIEESKKALEMAQKFRAAL